MGCANIQWYLRSGSDPWVGRERRRSSGLRRGRNRWRKREKRRRRRRRGERVEKRVLVREDGRGVENSKWLTWCIALRKEGRGNAEVSSLASTASAGHFDSPIAHRRTLQSPQELGSSHDTLASAKARARQFPADNKTVSKLWRPKIGKKEACEIAPHVAKIIALASILREPLHRVVRREMLGVLGDEGCEVAEVRADAVRVWEDRTHP